jgi:demethylmenaquinone methyltransferase / 2-methoxy-6-polyprenyl-1,4-benzoquinol methylase
MPTTASAAPGGPNRFAQRLFSPLPERYNRLAEVLSFGQNGRWRRAMIDHLVDSRPGLVLDVATGPAGVALQIAARTGARVVGLDVTEAMLRQAQRNVAEAGARVHLALGRGEQLPFADATFDAVTFTYLLRYVDDPAAAIGELTRVVKPGGVVANLEFNVPTSRFWHFWWVGYTRLVLPLAGWATGGREWFDVGRFLGPNISSHYRRYPVSWTVEAWGRAGLVDVGARAMSLGGGLVMWGRRAGA